MIAYKLFRACLLGLLAWQLTTGKETLAQEKYQRAPEPIPQILDVPDPASGSLNPTRDKLALISTSNYPRIEDLASPYVALAGYRFDPKTNGPRRFGTVTSVEIIDLNDFRRVKLDLPAGKIASPSWSPDGKMLAMTVTTDDGIDLWLANAETGEVKPTAAKGLNATLASPYAWLTDSNKLIVLQVPPDRGPLPTPNSVPVGPVIQESSGKAGPVRTYQDLLQDSDDEALFDYLTHGQVGLLDVREDQLKPIGPAKAFTSVSPSPDGNYLLVAWLRKPYSYVLPASRFPRTTEVWDMDGKVVQTVHEAPLQDNIPIDGVPTGPRSIIWNPVLDATLHWAEAQDGGDPKVDAPVRDAWYSLPAPFEGEPKKQASLPLRYSGSRFFPDGDSVLISEYDRDKRWIWEKRHNLSKPLTDGVVIFNRSAQDRYADPGSPIYQRLPNGRSAMWVIDDQCLYLGSGATPQGDRPFLNRFDFTSKKVNTELYRCREGFYEYATPLDAEGKRLLIRRETKEQPANYFVKAEDSEVQLTKNQDPFPEIRKARKERITAKRDDGVVISFTLYVPNGVKPGTKLPTVFYAYPREYNSADTAGQITGSLDSFTSVRGYSHLFFLTQGYAVMDQVSMPVVGPVETANDSFIEQLRANAKTALDAAEKTGYVDVDRVGVLGHSYGGFMTANLIAHTDLFKAGIARSGAYNRTLTPFGFQNEKRTYWEAPEVYHTMSPFSSANKVNQPLLLIHGQADNNAGTFPLQSERLYQAIRGNGGTTRLVMLPNESHGYSARESIEHVLYEQINWFDKYVKGESSDN